MARDWSSLPSPLLCSIAKQLIPVAYARVLAVCTHWCFALSPEEWEEGQQQSYYLPRSPHCPWLMVASAHDDETSESVTFLSLPDSLHPYRIAAPDIRNKRIIGSHSGWLTTIDWECNMCLVNPLTRSQISLPSITTFPAVKAVRDPDYGSIIKFLICSPVNPDITIDFPPEYFRDNYFQKIILSSSPSLSDHYVVVLIFGSFEEGMLLFMRAGDRAWSAVSSFSNRYRFYTDAVFVDKKLYTVSGYGEILVIDFTESQPRPREIAGQTSKYAVNLLDRRYLVLSSGGNHLLQLWRKVNENASDDSPYKTVKFIVEKLDLTDNGKKSRTVTKDLEGQSIFVGMNQSLIISAKGIAGLRSNCIYFTDDNEFIDNLKHDIGVYNLKEETVESLYPKKAWANWPLPVWFASF